jgi:hypothetical protein
MPGFCYRRIASSLGVLLFMLGLSVGASTPARPWRVQSEPARIVNGSPVLFRVTAPASVKELTGNFLGQELGFRRSAGCNCWYALAGVSLNTKPGRYTLHLAGKGAGMDADAAFDSGVLVGSARYPSSTLKIAPGFVEPPKEQLARIEEDQAAKKQAFAATRPEPLWAGRFLPPAPAEISGVFGTARVLNGVKKSQHTGLDFRVGTGTPVHATNNGMVILARPLYFEGNCVMVDHGQGLLTMYLHLSEIKVKEGDHVEAGQLLGLSGGTGRSTAPHLHFAVRWRGEYLNPATLLELHPPAK